MQDSPKIWISYIIAIIGLSWGIIKEIFTRKQKALTRESEAKAKKVEIDVSESLKESYKEDALAWRSKFEEEHQTNAEILKTNKELVEKILEEQTSKASYIEEIHKLRIEVAELRNIILKFQAQFPDLFKVT